MYPAPVAPLYSFFLNLPMRVRVFHCLSAGILLAAAIGFSFYVWRRGVPAWQAALVGLGSLLLSYPALFELKQANMEIFICLLVGAGVWCFATGRVYMAAACFGVAIAMKLFPFVYLGLFIPKKSYRPLLAALAVAAVVTLASLAYLGPTMPVAWHGIATDLHYYQQTVPTVMREQIGYDHSLFALSKRAIHQVFHRQKTDARFDTLLRIYMPVVGAFGVLIYFLRIRKLPFANQVLCLSIASVLLPPTSYDYTLLHLYIPWALLVLIALRKVNEQVPGIRAAFLCFAVTMSIETELILHARSFGGQIKALALVGLFTLALRFPFSKEQEGFAIPSGLAVNA